MTRLSVPVGIPPVDSSYGVNIIIGSGQLPCMKDFHTPLRLRSFTLCVYGSFHL